MTEPAPIKSMKLYHQVERVLNDIAAAGHGPDDPLDHAELSAFDQYHYLGTDAVDEAVRRLGLGSGHDVVEFGGGIGGPSRHLAGSVGCQMTTVELQPDLNALATQLTARCGLSGRIEHIEGNILDSVVPAEGFDALVSWLTFLHIPDRTSLYAECHRALRPEGSMYVEDYHRRGNFTIEERERLAGDVFCHHVPTLAEYEADLAAAGFGDIELIDMSDEWTAFVAGRLAAFRASRDELVDRHGVALVDGLDHFYSAVESLFSGGNLGGLRLVAHKR